MPIVSISMDAGTLAELAQMEKSLGFSGRAMIFDLDHSKTGVLVESK